MSSSKFSGPFMQKSVLSPLKGNAFIKAVKDAKDNNKTSFSFNGKNYPLKMVTPSPLNTHEFGHKETSSVEVKQPRFIKNPAFDKLTKEDKKIGQQKSYDAGKVITYKGVQFDQEDGALVNMLNPNYKPKK